MNTREAFRIFIRYQLQVMNDEDIVDLDEKGIEELASKMENDHEFYQGLSEFISSYIGDEFE